MGDDRGTLSMNSYKAFIEEREVSIYRFPYELVDSNMFFIPSGDTGIVFDPNENEELLRVFQELGTRSVEIVLTHEHYDHTTGVKWLQSKIETRLFCHRACAEAIATEKGNDPKTLGYILTLRDAVDGGHRRENFLATAKRYMLRADEAFDGDCGLKVGELVLRCHPAPGHSPGSALYFLGETAFFSGDSLIQHTPTIVHLPGSDRRAYKQEPKPYLRSLDKDMMVFPGHGEPFKLGEAEFL